MWTAHGHDIGFAAFADVNALGWSHISDTVNAPQGGWGALWSLSAARSNVVPAIGSGWTKWPGCGSRTEALFLIPIHS